MKNITHNPFKNLKLDAYEQEIDRSLNAGEWKPVKNLAREKGRIRMIAKTTLDKTRNINIRLTQRDLSRLRVKAMEEGLPYQTLAASILHKHVASS